jgi:hypothetical protein
MFLSTVDGVGSWRTSPGIPYQSEKLYHLDATQWRKLTAVFVAALAESGMGKSSVVIVTSAL